MTLRLRVLAGLGVALLLGQLLHDDAMDLPFVLLGWVPAVVVLGPLFLGQARRNGPPHGEGEPPAVAWERLRRRCVEALLRVRAALTGRGMGWALAWPAVWLIHYFAFVVHVRLALGRWPNFGEGLDGAVLNLQQKLCWGGLGALFSSLGPVGLVFVVCLFLPRWRPISAYAALYAAGVGLAFAGIYLAPGPFLNWFFD